MDETATSRKFRSAEIMNVLPGGFRYGKNFIALVPRQCLNLKLRLNTVDHQLPKWSSNDNVSYNKPIHLTTTTQGETDEKIKTERNTNRTTIILTIFSSLISLLILYQLYIATYNKAAAEVEGKNAELNRLISEKSHEIEKLRFEREINTYNHRLEELQEESSSVSKSLEEKKLQNGRLSHENTILKNENASLSSNLSSLQEDYSRVNSKLFIVNSDIRRARNELAFSKYAYYLKSIKDFATLNDMFVDSLINSLQTETLFKQRIIDSLVRISRIDSSGYYGLCMTILYFGTGDYEYKNGILETTVKAIPFKVLPKYIDCYDILAFPKWNTTERLDFTKLFLDNIRLTHQTDTAQKITLLDAIARMYNRYDFNLIGNNTKLFMRYVREAKQLYKVITNDDDKYTILQDMAIMCPQLFYSILINESDYLLNKLFPYFKKKAVPDSADELNTPVSFQVFNSKFSDRVMSRNFALLEKVSSDKSLSIFGSIKWLKKKYGHLFRFWLNNNYHDSEENMQEVKYRMLNNIF